MFYNVLKIEDLISANEKFTKKILMEDGDNQLVVISLKQGEMIDTHISLRDACAIVINGEIEIHFEAEKFTVSQGEILMFKKEKEHKVLAKQDSKFFIVKI